MADDIPVLSVSTDVGTPNSSHRDMAQEWDMTNALMGGTRAMRDSGKEYLPQYPGEDDIAYSFRLKWSYLFNYYKKAVKALVGKPFSRQLTYPDTMPPDLSEIVEDFDLQGNNITLCVKAWFEDAMASGVSYALIDYPDTGGAPMTLADERSLRIRPYFLHIKAIDIIGWKTMAVGGVRKLQQVRIRQTVAVSDGEFGEANNDVIRVLTCNPGATQGQRVTWATYQQLDNNTQDWTLTGSGFMTAVDEIPLVACYTGQTGFMTAEPPLLDMAYINIAHWQSNSDLRHIAHVLSVPILFGTGWSKDTTPKTMQVGPDRMLTTQQTDAKLMYVEHSGKAVSLLQAYMAQLEQEMITMAIKLIADKAPGGITATEISVDTATAESALKGMVIGLQDAITRVISFMYVWMGKTTPDDELPKFTVNMDFGLLQGNDAIANWLLKANTQGIVQKSTILNGAKSLGYVPEDLDVEEELEAAAEEASKEFANMQAAMADSGLNAAPPGTITAKTEEKTAVQQNLGDDPTGGGNTTVQE